MKHMFKVLFVAILVVAFSGIGNAQQFRADMSIKDQLIHNKVPGFKYVASPAQQATVTVNVSSTSKNTIPLPSDVSAEQSKAQSDQNKTASQPIAVPSQGNVTPEQKLEPVKPIVKVPTQEENPPVEKKKD